MARRLTSAEKGKGLANNASPPRRGRVSVPDFDNSELIKKHELTLIGRVTNPKHQRMWSLIPFLSDLWKCNSRPFGSDLGQGRFQFQFASAEDLQNVLDNRPYHFAKWMLILQQWEPSVSPRFPSQIPFWVQVQDLPLHLWNEAILRSVAGDIGTFESWEITASKARFRVHINGLQPLVFKTTLDFKNGDEVTVVLVYEKLEKFCTTCKKLDHEYNDCPQNPGQNPQETEHQNDLKTKAEEMADYRKNGSNQHAQHPNQRGISRQASGFMRDARRADYGTRSHSYRDNENKTRYVASKRAHTNESYSRSLNYYPRHSNSAQVSNYRKIGSRWVETGRRAHYSGTSHPPETNALSQSQKRLDCSRDANSEHLSSAQRQERPVSPQRSTQSDYQNTSRVPVPEEAIREAREELREVMIQYVNGADPSESAARRERMRYAEENGETEQVIMNMAIEATVSAEGARRTAETQTIVERILALSRLGSLHDQDTVDATEPEGDRRMSDVQTSAERISVLSRLGATQETIITPEADTPRITVKKRLGRPPLSRNQPKPLGVNTGVSSKKRKVAQVKISPKRRSFPTSSTRGPVSSRPTSTRRGGSANNSQPTVQIIPGIAKRKVDFQNPPAPIP